MSNVLLVNITWNPFGWRNNNYINPKAGHKYAQTNVGGESLNFNFNKRQVDDNKIVKGYVQWQFSPKRFEPKGLIIFYTRNTDLNKGQIVGIYGKADVYSEGQSQRVSFQKKEYWFNIQGEKDFSLLFPIPLDADNYKPAKSTRIVGQVGYTYKDLSFAESILKDQLFALIEAGVSGQEFQKLKSIYEYYIGKKFKAGFVNKDEKEQDELEEFYKKNKTKAEIIKDLQNLKESDPEEVFINRKSYKRDNKTIAQLKLLRDYNCQLCGLHIPKKDGGKYIEAAHILPKHKKGRETPDNILILCPNHHKEFDFGELNILNHTKDQITFKLNGKNHLVSLKV
ncbi:HNH endonuclease [Pontibacter sp. FD36]|uniref:HNH endonuclease n=1 Tax=Pontibacter sp. FD36 TaxID=2789860 RepID=UPI0018AB82EF|nr:HNH endonuclease [Pontibacter sp. FD36]MBF8964300.1 HNH endonuclease [Pontibacter sp. FD36]